MISYGQETFIPDDDFEAKLITLGYDSGPLDDFVTTSSIDTITSLDISNSGIIDLTGIVDFIALINLDFSENNTHTGVDLSQCANLENLDCSDNILYDEDLDLTQNSALKYLNCSHNYLSGLKLAPNPLLEILDCSYNDLKILNLLQNTFITELDCYSNQLNFLDLSNCVQLTKLQCSANYLVYLNVKNGNNTALTYFNSFYNDYLVCIQVDDATYSTTNWTGVNSEATFTEDCNYQYTYVPDNAFEQRLIDLNIDSGSPNEYVEIDDIDHIISLDLISADIYDLTGIQDFTALKYLYAGDNHLTNVDLSQNIFLEQFLGNLNNLVSLNIKNGNNEAITDFITFGNPDLICIQVDNVAYSTANWTLIDSNHHFSASCFSGINESEQNQIKLYPNPATNHFFVHVESESTCSIFNLNGQEVHNQILIIGQNEIQISTMTPGVYLICVTSENMQYWQKLVVQ